MTIFTMNSEKGRLDVLEALPLPTGEVVLTVFDGGEIWSIIHRNETAIWPDDFGKRAYKPDPTVAPNCWVSGIWYAHPEPARFAGVKLTHDGIFALVSLLGDVECYEPHLPGPEKVSGSGNFHILSYDDYVEGRRRGALWSVPMRLVIFPDAA